MARDAKHRVGEVGLGVEAYPWRRPKYCLTASILFQCLVVDFPTRRPKGSSKITKSLQRGQSKSTCEPLQALESVEEALQDIGNVAMAQSRLVTLRLSQQS